MGGLKSNINNLFLYGIQSHPTRDGWIEILACVKLLIFSWSHPTRDGWIEITKTISLTQLTQSPIPHGMGGLKYGVPEKYIGDCRVPSHTGWVD